jgi:integrase
VQNFINRNRDKYQDPSHEGVNLTFHGLRHTRAAELYVQCVRSGIRDLDARRHVSKYLGHERDDVTRIYLAK